MTRTVIRVQVSRDREKEACEELKQLAQRSTRRTPYTQGTSGDLMWDWTGTTQLEDAQLFYVNAKNTPGVARVSEPETRSY